MAELSVPAVEGEDPTITLCRFAVETGYDGLPPDLVSFAKRHILDTMGVTIGGSSQEGISAVVDFVKDQGGKEESSIPFFGGKVPASSAALAIGPMARALDMADAHLGKPGVVDLVGHTSEYTIPALLGACGLKPQVSGKEFITAFAVGQEVLCRVGGSIRNSQLWALHGEGVDQGGFYIYGAVAAVANLLGLNLEETIMAMGIAKGMTQPHDAKMYTPMTLMVRIHHGLVAQAGIICCLLAKKGITGPRGVLLGKTGHIYMYTRGQWEADTEVLTRDLGKLWLMKETSFKLFSSCRLTHTGTTGLLTLMEENNFEAQDIAKIHAGVSATTYGLCCTPREPKWNPQTDYDAQFSVPYVLATIAFQKKFLIEEFQEPTRGREDIRRLMSNITVSKDDQIGRFDTRLSITLNDGREFTTLCTTTKGNPDLPFDEKDWADKFNSLARYSAYELTAATVASLIDRILNLEEVDDVTRELILPLTPQDG